jgi:hypothetical protein
MIVVFALLKADNSELKECSSVLGVILLLA